MSLERICGLSAEQALALYLYAKVRDKEFQGLERSSVMFVINTAHPHSPRMNDIAGDFDRYVGKDNLLAECYDTAREAIYGER
jgi:hypothetical protein